MKPLIALTISATLRYVRNFSSWIFSLVIPIFLIVIFGFFSSNGATKFSIGLIDEANNDASKQFISMLYCGNATDCDKKDEKKTEKSPFKITEDSIDKVKTQLRKGDLVAVLIIPANFNPADPSQLTFLQNQGKEQSAATASLVLNQIIDNAYNIDPQTKKVSLKAENFESKNLTIIDFLVPGILAINIMNLGLFAVAFTFVSQKSNGVLKRLLATPITGKEIILSESFSKLVVAILQILIFIGVGALFFNLKVQGSIFSVLLVAIPGIIIFLALGFAIAGYSKDENQVAPLAQLVNLPMTFLSGAFFPRDVFPAWLKTITDYFPVTFITDALRSILNDGASAWDVRGQIIGLVIWAFIAILIAFKMFRWK